MTLTDPSDLDTALLSFVHIHPIKEPSPMTDDRPRQAEPDELDSYVIEGLVEALEPLLARAEIYYEYRAGEWFTLLREIEAARAALAKARREAVPNA